MSMLQKLWSVQSPPPAVFPPDPEVVWQNCGEHRSYSLGFRHTAQLVSSLPVMLSWQVTWRCLAHSPEISEHWTKKKKKEEAKESAGQFLSVSGSHSITMSVYAAGDEI